MIKLLRTIELLWIWYFQLESRDKISQNFNTRGIFLDLNWRGKETQTNKLRPNQTKPNIWWAISSRPTEIWSAWMLTCLQIVPSHSSFQDSSHWQFHPCQKYNGTYSRSCPGLVAFTGSLCPQIRAEALFLSKEQHLASSCAHLHANTGLLSQRTAI